MRPTFIGIGAQKCASSWIYEILSDHPQVAVSSTKELDFFSYRYELGLRWYERQFGTTPTARVRGEVSPSYLHEPAVVPRALAYAPDLKIVVSLRNPVDRALSQHRHLVRLGAVPENDLSFESALQTNPTYVEQGDYNLHLERWAAAFGTDSLHTILVEDVERDPRAVASALYRFLGVDADHEPEALTVVKNPSYVVRNRPIEATKRALRQGLLAVGGGRAWKMLGDTGLRSLYRSVNRVDSSRVIPQPRPETLDALRERFRPGIERLSARLDRDLSHWHRPTPDAR